MEIIQPRTPRSHTEYRHEFRYRDIPVNREAGRTPGAGFSFDVTEAGEIVVTDNNLHNVEFCLVTHPHLMDDLGVTEDTHEWVDPAVGRCSCGREVVLEGFTNTCDCGADYNSAGQRLAPREQWGEETGESLGEILAIP